MTSDNPRGHISHDLAKQAYAAIDLGTNSCRMLVAVPCDSGFHVIDGFSKVVRLGEKLSDTGILSDKAIERTVRALTQCATRLNSRRIVRSRAVATQACRQASNTDVFLERVIHEAGLQMEVIDPVEEASLTVAGCGELLCSDADRALVFDIGGGSTEIMWVETLHDGQPKMLDTISLPFGVVSLRDENGAEALPPETYDGLINHIDGLITPFDQRNGISEAIAANRVRMIGTSGTVTTLAAMHLQLPRYNRSRVDGLEMDFNSMLQISARLTQMSCAERIAHPCLGHGRGDLMLMGLVVLRAICDRWPVGRLRVADRGIREGVLFDLMAQDGHMPCATARVHSPKSAPRRQDKG